MSAVAIKPKSPNRLSISGASGLAALMSLFAVFVLAAPAHAAGLGANDPVLCQALVDGYAGVQAKETDLPDLFDAPFSFESMDWADDAGAKAVNVLKQQFFAEIPGMMGALYCLPDGLVKQMGMCAETAESDGVMPAIDRFRKMGAAFFDVVGATDEAREALSHTVDVLTGASTGDVPPGGFIKLEGPVYAFITAEDGAVCMTLSQTTKQ